MHTTENTNPATLIVSAYFTGELHPAPGIPQHCTFSSVYFPTRDEADAFAAQFPKLSKLRVQECTGMVYGSDGDKHWGSLGFNASGWASLVADGTTGEANETGINRYRKTVAKAEKLGLHILFDRNATSNAYINRDEFEAELPA